MKLREFLRTKTRVLELCVIRDSGWIVATCFIDHTGMNAGRPWKYLDGVYIGHDITEEQAKIMIKVFEENDYNIQPKEYDPSIAFYIKEVIK